MKKFVIFDLDGTLLDTIRDLGNATDYALRSVGLPGHPSDAYKFMVGNGVDMLLRRAMPSGEDKNEDLFLRVKKAFHEYYDSHCTDFTEPYPGISTLLEDLVREDVALAVTSNKYQTAVSKIIGFYFPDIPFKAILGNREGVPRKPDPSIVFMALSEFPCPKSETLYVGDSGVDMETGRRACVDTAGVTWGFRPLSELKSKFPEFIVNRPEEIFDIVVSER